MNGCCSIHLPGFKPVRGTIPIDPNRQICFHDLIGHRHLLVVTVQSLNRTWMRAMLQILELVCIPLLKLLSQTLIAREQTFATCARKPSSK